MSKDAVFTMKLEPALRADFMAAVTAEDRPASQVMRELMRNYIEQCQVHSALSQRTHSHALAPLPGRSRAASLLVC